MNQIRQYEISFNHNGVYQTHIVETDKTPEEIKDWYMTVRNVLIIAGVRAFTGIPKPGQPIVRI